MDGVFISIKGIPFSLLYDAGFRRCDVVYYRGEPCLSCCDEWCVLFLDVLRSWFSSHRS